jgi:hypothetical protein
MADRSYTQREEQANRQEHEEEKKQQGEEKEGKRGNDTHRLGTYSSCVLLLSVRHISPLSSLPPTSLIPPSHYNSGTSTSPLPFQPTTTSVLALISPVKHACGHAAARKRTRSGEGGRVEEEG